MTNYIFKIACHDKSMQVPKIVQAVFNSVPFSLDIYKNPEEFHSNIADKKYDLVIINRLNTKITSIDVKKRQLTKPETSIIIIDENHRAIDDWLDIHQIKFLTEDEIVQKLPLFLGEIYAQSNQKLSSGFNYLEVINDSLKLINRIIILVDSDAGIFFLNHEAEKFLGVENQEYLGLPVTDYIVDGDKIWNFIDERCIRGNEKLTGYKIVFRDAFNIEKQKMISAIRLTPKQNFVLIETESHNDIPKPFSADDQYELLDKFADSIANDLLNPVNIISGRIQLLKNDLQKNEKYKKSFEALEKQLNRIQDVTSKMLTFARLKQDTVPQKIELNRIFKNALSNASIKSILRDKEIQLSLALKDDIPVLEGLNSHFDLLIRTILEICFICLGKKGSILVETEHLNNYLNSDWIGFKISLNYNESVFTKKENLHTFLNIDQSGNRSVTIESTIVDHIIRHYRGDYQLHREGQNKETIILLFPVPEPRH